MTPTDPIPFTLGMAETIAATFDHLGKHNGALALRNQVRMVNAEQRGEVVRVGEEPKPETFTKIDAMQAEINHWKANHDRVVEINRALQDRPDLGDRAKSIASLQSQLAAEREAVRVFANDFYRHQLRPYSREYQDNVLSQIIDPIARAAIERARKDAGQ